jgi:hypothetical protein
MHYGMCQVQAIVHSKLPMKNLGEVSPNFGMGSEPGTMAGTQHTSFGNGFIWPFLLDPDRAGSHDLLR